jgi:hypothetical protein
MTLHQQILPLASSWRCRMLALFGHGAMSDLSPECVSKRTSVTPFGLLRFGGRRVAFRTGCHCSSAALRRVNIIQPWLMYPLLKTIARASASCVSSMRPKHPARPFDGAGQDRSRPGRPSDPIECPNCPTFRGRCRNALKSLVFAVIDLGHRVAVPIGGCPSEASGRGHAREGGNATPHH